MVSPEGTPLLTGFGISRMYALSAGYTTRSVGGSTRWQAFELFDIRNDGAHTKMTDVWAFGMTVYVGYSNFIRLNGSSADMSVTGTLTHNRPYHNVKRDPQVALMVSEGRKPVWRTEAPDVPRHEPLDKEIEDFMWSICNKCWTINYEERPTMQMLTKEIHNYAMSISVEVDSVTAKASY